jgi:hypothetical protein
MADIDKVPLFIRQQRAAGTVYQCNDGDLAPYSLFYYGICNKPGSYLISYPGSPDLRSPLVDGPGAHKTLRETSELPRKPLEVPTHRGAVSDNARSIGPQANRYELKPRNSGGLGI